MHMTIKINKISHRRKRYDTVFGIIIRSTNGAQLFLMLLLRYFKNDESI